jgi:uncharacterized membrane protein (UPF0127 family)
MTAPANPSHIGRTGSRLRSLLPGLALALWAAGGPAAQGREPILDLATYPREEAVVESAGNRRHPFRVWIADTDERQRQGLMYVRDLPQDQGMLFVNRPPRPASFWMKNTYIELDLLFIDPTGKVLRIFERATPFSLEPMSVDAPVRAVLEIKGGESARRGIKVGDRVRHRAFRSR